MKGCIVSVLVSFIFSLTFTVAVAQKVNHFQLVNGATKLPVGNVHVKIGERAVAVDSLGFFNLPSSNGFDSLTVCCYGYQSIRLSSAYFNENEKLWLQPIGSSLNQSHFSAHDIVKKAIINSVNPDEFMSYQTAIYKKMTVTNKNININDGYSVDDNKQLFMHESLIDKRRDTPNLPVQKIVSTRFTGNNDTIFSLLDKQFNPFLLYQPQIEIGNHTYINPISSLGLNTYLYEISDTLVDKQGDSLWIISFLPKTNHPHSNVKGDIQIGLSSFNVVKVKMASVETANYWSFQLSVLNSHQADLYWFPAVIEYAVLAQPLDVYDSDSLIVIGKVQVTAVKVEQISPSSLHGDDHLYTSTLAIDSTQISGDTLSITAEQQQAEKLNQLNRNLIEGFIPIGPINLDYRKVIDYTSFEGFKLGLGLWTGNKISEMISVGGYFTHAFKINSNDYGAGFKLNVNPKHKTLIKGDYQVGYAEIGNYAFHNGYKPRSAESFRKFLSQTMDRHEQVGLTIESKLSKALSGSVSYKFNDVQPVSVYDFASSLPVELPYSVHEVGIKGKLQTGSLRNNTSDDNKTMPLVWFNVLLGNGSQNVDFSYSKYEIQADYTYSISKAQSIFFRVTGATLNGKLPLAGLYSSFGTQRSFGLYIPNSFSTMHMNEFAATSFAISSVSYFYRINANRKVYFKPIVDVSLKVGWGMANRSNTIDEVEIKSFDKGYYEAGVVAKELFGTKFVKYGIGCLYRLGDYRFSRWQDNFVVMFSVDFLL